MKTKTTDYWYMMHHYECPICGLTTTLKTRMYTPRPDEFEKRNVWVDDACGGHFL